MKQYAPMTVGELIAHLGTLDPEAEIEGLEADTGSYRGYYEHVYVSPGKGVRAGDLRALIESHLGTTMHGWKGGEYTYRAQSYVFVAYGGSTGPTLVGFDGLEPVTAREGWY